VHAARVSHMPRSVRKISRYARLHADFHLLARIISLAESLIMDETLEGLLIYRSLIGTRACAPNARAVAVSLFSAFLLPLPPPLPPPLPRRRRSYRQRRGERACLAKKKDARLLYARLDQRVRPRVFHPREICRTTRRLPHQHPRPIAAAD